MMKRVAGITVAIVLLTACASPTPEPEPTPTSPPEPTNTPQPTNTPTDTPEPTSTPTPEYVEGEILFEDDFELGYLSGWIVKDGQWTVIDDGTGNHVLSIESTTWASIFAGSEDWEDYAVEVQGMLGEPMPDAQNLHLSFFVRSHPFAQDCQFYTAAYTPDDTSAIKGGVGECNPWIGLGPSSVSPLEYERWYTLRAEVFGPRIRVYRDGELLVDTGDDELTSGSIGFFAPPGNVHRYDDVRVIELLPWPG